MKNLKPINKDAFDIYKDAVARKREGVEKNFLNANETDVKSYYKEYDTAFGESSLGKITPHNLAPQLKSALYGMYSYTCKAVRDIRNEINNINPPNVTGFCQNCGLTSANTMDHYLPHDSFPEYSIHAKNLIPCCSECNERKGKDEILNVYLDEFPNVEYLFMDVERDGEILSFTFGVENKCNAIDSKFFKRIENHYNRLDLFRRMKYAAINALSRFEIDIKKNYLDRGKDYVVEIISESIEDLRKAYGYNYWEVAFREGLMNSSQFWTYYDEKVQKGQV